jgi:hypothetical protein
LYGLFQEYFAEWINNIENWEAVNERAIKVIMNDGRVYEFGCKENGEMYLITLKQPDISQK